MFDSYKHPDFLQRLELPHPSRRLEQPALCFEQVMEDRLIEFVGEALAQMAMLVGQQRSLNLAIDRLLRTPGYHK